MIHNGKNTQRDKKEVLAEALTLLESMTANTVALAAVANAMGTGIITGEGISALITDLVFLREDIVDCTRIVRGVLGANDID